MNHGKKWLPLLLAVALIGCAVVACDSGTSPITTACTHVWSNYEETTEPGCETDGIETRTCTLCGITETQPGDPALGHDWDYAPGATLPTCIADGHGSRECDRCGEIEDDVDFPMLGHDLDWTETTPATCSDEGEETGTCQRAGCTHSETSPLAIVPTAHEWGGYVQTTLPTCEEAGIETRECTLCGDIDTDTQEGEPALGHDFIDNWTVTTAATASAAGEETEYCQRADCSHFATRPIYIIIMQDDGNGTAEASPAAAAFGIEVTITATPDQHYIFEEWQVISGGVTLSGTASNPATFTMPANAVTIKATFEELLIDVLVTNYTKEYNGTPQGATVVYDGDFNEGNAGELFITYENDTGYDNSATPPINAGEYRIMATTAGGSVYDAITVPVRVGTLTISAKPLTWIGGIVEDKTYDRTTDAEVVTEPALNGVIAGDEVTVTIGTAEFADFDAGTSVNVTATGYGVTGDDAANYTAPSGQPPFANAAINRKPLTWATGGVVADKPYDDNATATVTTQPTLGGLIPLDIVTVAAGTVTFDDVNAAPSIGVTATGYGINGLRAANYNAPTAQPTFANAAITRLAGATLAAPTLEDKTHNSITVDPITASTGQPVEYGISEEDDADDIDEADWQLETYFDGLDPETTYFIFARAMLSTNYEQGPASDSLEVTTDEVLIEVLVDDYTKEYNRTPQGATVVYDGDFNVGNAGALTVTYINATYNDATPPTNAGEYRIMAANGGGSVYPAVTEPVEVGRLTISPKPLTWATQGIVEDKTYDRTTNTTVTTQPTLAGVIAGDTVTVTNGAATFASWNANTSASVTATGYGINGADAANYTLGQPALQPTFADAVISPKTLTWAADGEAADKIYDRTTDAAATTQPTLVGVETGDTVTRVNGTVAFDDMNVGTDIGVTAEDYGINGAHADNYNAPVAQPAFATAAITAKTITITGVAATNRSFSPDNTIVAISGGTLVGVETGDSVNAVVPATGTIATADAANNKAVTIADITLGGAQADNYTLTQPTGLTVNITQAEGETFAALTVTRTATSITVTSPLTPASTGQTIEYARNDINEAPWISTQWQTDVTFIGLNPGTTYFIFAMAVPNNNYTRTFSEGLSVTTLVTGNVNISFADFDDVDTTLSAGTIHLVGTAERRTAATITVANAEIYDSIEWIYNGNPITANIYGDYGQRLEVNSGTYNGIGQYAITVRVKLDGKLYSQIVNFTVAP